MKTIKELKAEIGKLKKDLENSDDDIRGGAWIMFFVRNEQLKQSKDILKVIKDMIEIEKGCMKEDTYEEQILEHQFALEPLEKLKSKIEGNEKER